MAQIRQKSGKGCKNYKNHKKWQVQNRPSKVVCQAAPNQSKGKRPGELNRAVIADWIANWIADWMADLVADWVAGQFHELIYAYAMLCWASLEALVPACKLECTSD